MSRKLILILTLGLLVGIGSTAVLTTPSKSPVQPRISGKMHGDQISRHFFELSFEEIQIPNADHEVTRVSARIHALKDVPQGLHYKWSVSDGVDMESSQELIESTLPAIEKGQEYVLSLDVRGFSKNAARFVNLIVGGQIQGFKVARNLILPSRPEDTLEHALHQSARSQASLANNGAARLILNKASNKEANQSELLKRFSIENVVR